MINTLRERQLRGKKAAYNDFKILGRFERHCIHKSGINHINKGELLLILVN